MSETIITSSDDTNKKSVLYTNAVAVYIKFPLKMSKARRGVWADQK